MFLSMIRLQAVTALVMTAPAHYFRFIEICQSVILLCLSSKFLNNFLYLLNPFFPGDNSIDKDESIFSVPTFFIFISHNHNRVGQDRREGRAKGQDVPCAKIIGSSKKIILILFFIMHASKGV